MFALELSRGKFGQRINLQGKRRIKEIKDLSESINQMSITLRDTINNLTEEKNKLKYVLTGMEEGVLAINNKREIILINNSARRLLGARREDQVNNHLEDVIKDKRINEMFTIVFAAKELYSTALTLSNRQSQSRLLVHLTPIKINDVLWGIAALSN